MEGDEKKRKKGGAAKVREKKIKLLKADAAKCRKLSDMFASRKDSRDRVQESELQLLEEGEADLVEGEAATDALPPGPSDANNNVVVVDESDATSTSQRQPERPACSHWGRPAAPSSKRAVRDLQVYYYQLALVATIWQLAS